MREPANDNPPTAPDERELLEGWRRMGDAERRAFRALLLRMRNGWRPSTAESIAYVQAKAAQYRARGAD